MSYSPLDFLLDRFRTGAWEPPANRGTLEPRSIALGTLTTVGLLVGLVKVGVALLSFLSSILTVHGSLPGFLKRPIQATWQLDRGFEGTCPDQSKDEVAAVLVDIIQIDRTVTTFVVGTTTCRGGRFTVDVPSDGLLDELSRPGEGRLLRVEPRSPELLLQICMSGTPRLDPQILTVEASLEDGLPINGRTLATSDQPASVLVGCGQLPDRNGSDPNPPDSEAVWNDDSTSKSRRNP